MNGRNAPMIRQIAARLLALILWILPLQAGLGGYGGARLKLARAVAHLMAGLILGSWFDPRAAYAAFQNAPSSVKAEALGGAFAAMADDPTALFLNPAGLSTLRSPEASIMYGKPLAGLEGLNLSSGYAAFAMPLSPALSLGLGGTLFNASGLLSEYQALAGLSAKMGKRLSAGINATYLRHSYDIAKNQAYASEPAFAGGNSKGAMGIDLGLLAKLSKNIQLGLSARNLNSPDVGLSQEDRVPRQLRLGGLYLWRHVGLLADFESRSGGSGGEPENIWRAGVEVPVRMISLRAGANSDGLTAGLGVRFGMFRLDYAFAMLSQVQASNFGSQTLALSFRMGDPDSKNHRATTRALRGHKTVKSARAEDIEGVFYGIQ